MRDEMTRDSREINVRPSSFSLWSGIFCGPVAWIINLQLRYALVSWACERGSRWVLTLIGVPLLVVCAAGVWLSWHGLAIGEDETRYPARVRFMSYGGVMLSAVFGLTILASMIPDFFLSPCD
jgi:hypothetical protein